MNGRHYACVGYYRVALNAGRSSPVMDTILQVKLLVKLLVELYVKIYSTKLN